MKLSIFKIAAPLSLALLFAAHTNAQEAQAAKWSVQPGTTRSATTTAAVTAAKANSRTGSVVFKHYLVDAFGPVGMLRAAASAGIAQANDDPPEWHQGAKGYGRRLGSKFGQHVVQETVLYGLSAPFGQDPTYYKCDCSGFGRRFGHAIASSFTALNRNEKRVFSPARIIAPFAAGQVAANGWYPDRFGPKDGLRMGVQSFLTGIGVNVFKEFIWGGRQHP